MYDFVELFVLRQRGRHVGENPGNFKNGAVFDVLPTIGLYKRRFHCRPMPEKCVCVHRRSLKRRPLCISVRPPELDRCPRAICLGRSAAFQLGELEVA